MSETAVQARKPCMLTLSAAVQAADQWSKLWVERTFALYERREVVAGFFDLHHVKNTGIAFGLFPSGGQWLQTGALILFAMLALCLVTYLFAQSVPSQRLLLLALALVLGGAVGNIVDRIAFQQVTDFFDAYLGSRHWPTFNVADSAITVGIVLLAFESFFGASAARGQEANAG